MDAGVDSGTDAAVDASFSDVAPTTSACSPNCSTTICHQYRITINPAILGTCASGWVIRLYDRCGYALDSAPGAPLVFNTDSSWVGWAMFRAQCGGVNHDFSSALGQNVASVGISVIMDGVTNLSTQTMVCRNTFGDPATDITPALPVQSGRYGLCP